MATKKQKRLAGEARQMQNREETIRTGLLAQRKDQERRKAVKAEQARKASEEKQEKLRAKGVLAMRKLAGDLVDA